MGEVDTFDQLLLPIGVIIIGIVPDVGNRLILEAKDKL